MGAYPQAHRLPGVRQSPAKCLAMKKRRPAKKSSEQVKSRVAAKPRLPRRPAATKTRAAGKPAQERLPAEDEVRQGADRAFSWYPGHMVKAKRELESNLKLADAVLLMLDARAPTATRHPELEEILRQRYTPFLLVLNKSDLADAKETERWRTHLKAQGFKVVEMSALKGQGTGPLTPMLDQLEKETNERRANKGLLPRNSRLMVAGPPNSCASTVPYPKWEAAATMRGARAARSSAINFLESRRKGNGGGEGRITHTATRGPARGPRPTSSIPTTTRFLPKAVRSNSRLVARCSKAVSNERPSPAARSPARSQPSSSSR